MAYVPFIFDGSQIKLHGADGIEGGQTQAEQSQSSKLCECNEKKGTILCPCEELNSLLFHNYFIFYHETSMEVNVLGRH